MKLTKKIAWPSIFVISGLIWLSVALLGHFFWKLYFGSKQPTPVEDTTLINHSELKPLATANE